MATYDSVTRWASKTDRKSVQLWLPSDVVEALDEQAKDQRKPDPVTGGKRKVSRADVITGLVREGGDRWEEAVTRWGALYENEGLRCDDEQARCEEALSEASEAREVQYKAERRVDQMEGELEAMRARMADLEREIKQKARLLADQKRRVLELMGEEVSE